MTLMQIEKAKNLLSKAVLVNGPSEMQDLVSEIKVFYGDNFSISLNITNLNTQNAYSQEHEKTDKISIQNFLEAQLAQDKNAPAILDILSLIEEGKQAKSNGDGDLREKYISKVFYSYSDRINFDKMTVAIATAPQDAWNLNMYRVSEEMVDGIIAKLKSYANILSTCKQSNEANNSLVQNKQEINFQPHISIEANNEINVNICVSKYQLLYFRLSLLIAALTLLLLFLLKTPIVSFPALSDKPSDYLTNDYLFSSVFPPGNI